MDTDYVLIAVDSQSRFAIRFACLSHAVKDSLAIHLPGPALAAPYAEFLVASAICGSRLDDQEATLFKLQLGEGRLNINCEVTPRGAMRSAIFPQENKSPDSLELSGLLKVVRLKSGDDVYESVVAISGNSIQDVFRHYLKDSVQTACLFFAQSDPQHVEKSYALWIEKLPDTTSADWDVFRKNYEDGARFTAAIAASDDPDEIIRSLFEEPIRILAVTKPKLVCSCSKERVCDAIKLLPAEDLAELFMEGKGVSTTCDYCGREWQISDDEVKDLLGAGGTPQ